MENLLSQFKTTVSLLTKPSLANCHWVPIHPRIILTCFASTEQEKQVSLYVSSFPGQPFFLYNLSAERLEGKELVKAVHEDLFKNQVLEFSLPHHPSPLEVLLNLCHSVHSWLDADPVNVAIIHSLSMGRASMAAACVLAFCGLADSGPEAIAIVESKHNCYKGAASPGQRRYVRYVCDLMHVGRLPHPAPLAMSSIAFGMPSGVESETIVLQVLKGKQILFSSDWKSLNVSVTPDMFRASDVCIGLIGDVSLRVLSGKTVLFRFAIHTGFNVPGEIRVGTDQVDDLKAPVMTGWELRLTLDPVSVFPELDGDVRNYLDTEAARIATTVASLVAKRAERVSNPSSPNMPSPMIRTTSGNVSGSLAQGAPLPGAGAAPAASQTGPTAASLASSIFSALKSVGNSSSNHASAGAGSASGAGGSSASSSSTAATTNSSGHGGGSTVIPTSVPSAAAGAVTGPSATPSSQGTAQAAPLTLDTAVPGVDAFACAHSCAKGWGVAATGSRVFTFALSKTASPTIKELGTASGEVSCVRIAAEGLAAAGSMDSSVVIWNQGKSVVTQGHIAEITGLTFCRDDSHVASAGSDFLLNLWSLTGELVWSLQEAVSVTAGPFGGLSLLPGSSTEAISVVYNDEETPSLSRFDLVQGAKGDTKDLAGTPLGSDLDSSALAGLKVTFGGDKLFVPLEGSVIATYSVETGEKVAVAVCSRMELFCTNPDGSLLLVCDRSPAWRVLRVADLGSDGAGVIKTGSLPAMPTSATYIGNGPGAEWMILCKGGRIIFK